MFENPFKAGGKLSREADDIVDAIKTGKLSVNSNSEPLESLDKAEVTLNSEYDDENKESLVKPLFRKNGIMGPGVQQRFKGNRKEDMSCIKEGKKKTYNCCILL